MATKIVIDGTANRLKMAIDALKESEKFLVRSVDFCEGHIRHQDMNRLLWNVSTTMKYLSPTISQLENLLRAEEVKAVE